MKPLKFIYIQALGKNSNIVDKDIAGVIDYSNQNADRFLEELKRNDINYFDLRSRVTNLSQQEYHELFFRTDHHWKPQTALWAANEVACYLNKNYGFNLECDKLSPDKFYENVYENYFLGSQGKKVTLAKTKPESISLLYPKYETNLHYEVPLKNKDLYGDFSIIYEMKHVSKIDYYGLNCYAAYTYADQPVSRLEDYDVRNNLHVAYIKDSFSNPETAFLSLVIRRLDMLDIRHFDGSVEKYLEENKPDIVIVQYHPGEIGVSKAGVSTTHLNMFNFR